MKNKKGIYRLNFDCGRMGNLEGIFVEESERVKILVEEDIIVYFGEVLGKHSEVEGHVDSSEIKLITEDEDAVNTFIKFELETGYNPFQYSILSFEMEGLDLSGDEDLTVSELVDKIIELKK